MKDQKKKTQSKNFHTTKEIAEVLQVKPHILKYWERKLPALKPFKIANRRYYSDEQLKLLQRVKSLLEQGLTFQAIKRELEGFKETDLVERALPTPNLDNPILFPEFKEVIQQKKSPLRSVNGLDLKVLLTEVLRELIELYARL